MFKSAIIAILTLLLTAIAAQAKTPDIKTQQFGSGSYQLTLDSSEVSSLEEAQSLLVPTAKKLCGDKNFQFGKFEFFSREPIQEKDRTKKVFHISQEVACVESATGMAPQKTSSSAGGWKPTESDNATIVALTYRYLAAKDSGKLDEAALLMSPEMKAASPDWTASVKHFNAAAGNVKSRTIKAISWEKDPARANRPGIYVAVDYVGDFEKLDVACGYVAWWRQEDGSYLLVHEENGFLEKKAAAKLNAKELEKMKAALHCAGVTAVPENAAATRTSDQCHPIAPDRIAQYWEQYRSQPDVEPLKGNDKYECISIKRTMQVVCRTLPANPAHPSIVIRTVSEEKGNVFMRTEADTAGDCKAFLDMMEQYKQLDEKMRNEIKR